jgi:hypothetical protein
MNGYEITKKNQSNELFTYFALFLLCDSMISEDVVKEIKDKSLCMIELMVLRKTILKSRINEASKKMKDY